MIRCMKHFRKLFSLFLAIIVLLCACGEKTVPQNVYTSRAMVIFTDKSLSEATLTSSGVVEIDRMDEALTKFLQAEQTRAMIEEKFSDAEYELSFAMQEETAIYCIQVSGKTPDNLTEICNLTVSYLSETIEQWLPGYACHIVDTASAAAPVAQ